MIAHLQDGWAESAVQPGDSINIVGVTPVADAHGGYSRVVLDSSQGLLVLHPDVLLSGTSITGASHCVRQAWLQEQLAGDTNDKVKQQDLNYLLYQASPLSVEPEPFASRLQDCPKCISRTLQTCITEHLYPNPHPISPC